MSESHLGGGRRQWVVMHPNDDVAVALTPLAPGTEVAAEDGSFSVVIRQPIPFGHKFAIRRVAKGAPVHKYGQVIGGATADIEPGEHVHVHNVDSLRARGDLLAAAQGGQGKEEAQ
ncbi:MAG: UxaA family hydrolase [Alicyclobacillus macrosporangiidus]|uniref:UxaA family hydrolase n=1 Tax=Alicyclobacillus macrosporangiidus TaxID=392015 RepID=UPI0026F1DC2F|nr:UxaA family hydrolase [Alicyclobacillus macrosporangiidus]MCL6599471.1 UxaA family hydrolase [Alicyclobacillus macrosporangiidus]